MAPFAGTATNTIPIVTAVSNDPVQAGLVASLAKSGGNVTGVTFVSSELAAKRLQFLKQTAPDVSRLAVVAGWVPWVEAGALLSYGSDLNVMVRRTAT